MYIKKRFVLKSLFHFPVDGGGSTDCLTEFFGKIRVIAHAEILSDNADRIVAFGKKRASLFDTVVKERS